ncbi:MAG: DUF1579 family protein [Phycisphaeraceae bacterium]|nr:MAG: DUF1579 family protein [Phycisphaeraceae bacterium]
MSTDTQSQMDACMAAAATAPEHELLKAFEGTWKAEVKMWMDPSADPMVSTGIMKNTLVLGGRFLEQDYADDQGHFFGRGFWGYNKTDARWEGVWMDTMCTFMMVDHGRHDAGAKTWTMSSEMTCPQTKQLMSKRSVITQHADDRHTMEMYFTYMDGEQAGQEMKCMEINYRKA